MTELVLAAGAAQNIDAQGFFVYVETATGKVGISAILDNGETDEIELNPQDQYQFAARIRSLRVRNLHTASQTIVVKSGYGLYRPRNDGDSVTIVGTAATSSVDIGAKADASATTDTGTFSLLALFKRSLEKLTALIALLPASIGAKTAAESLSVTVASDDTTRTLTGAVTETAPASDTASSGLNGRLQRIAQRITSLIALLPAALGQTTKAGSLSVAVASDQTLNVSSDATAAAGGLSSHHLVTEATTNETLVKATRARLYGVMVRNSSANSLKVAIYDSATAVTAGTGTPKLVVALGAWQNAVTSWTSGIDFVNGIAYTTTTGIADANATAVAAEQASIDIIYK